MSEVCVIGVNPIDLAQSIDAASTIHSRFSIERSVNDSKQSMHAR